MTTEAVLQGSLSFFKLPDVLSFLGVTRKTGALHLALDEKAATVWFRGGAVVFATSNQTDLRLSAILLRKRRIERDAFERIDALMRSEGGRFGQLAIQQGVLTEAQLSDFLKVQVSEILYDSFVWNGGTFAFDEQTALPRDAVTISIDLANLIMEGARRIEQWAECERLLPDANVVFRVVSRPEKDGKITLSIDEWNILFLINGRRTLSELTREAGDEPLHVYRVVYGLWANKLLEIVPADVHADETDGRTIRLEGSGLDATMRQEPVNFGAESTVREVSDDTSLLVSSDAKLSFRDVVKPMAAQLTVITGESNGAVFPLIEQEYAVGRNRENPLQFNDLGVSGTHARLYRGPEGYVIEDLKSRNGTWVNGARVFHANLNDGDHLRLGATELEYRVLTSAH